MVFTGKLRAGKLEGERGRGWGGGAGPPRGGWRSGPGAQQHRTTGAERRAPRDGASGPAWKPRRPVTVRGPGGALHDCQQLISRRQLRSPAPRGWQRCGRGRRRPQKEASVNAMRGLRSR